MNAPAHQQQTGQQLAAPRQEKADPVKALQAQIKSGHGEIAAALPAHIPPEKFVRVLMTAVAKNPELAAADRRTLFNSCLEAAADGLLPNGKESALVIFNTKVKRDGRDVWIKAVQYIPMIAGLYKKARNSGEIALLNAHVVYERDEFSFAYGFDIDIQHKPHLGDDRGNAVAVYAAAVLKDGTRDVEVMTIADVEKVRKVSKTGGSGPWVQWWDEMARKTAMRRLMKRLPLSEDLEKAIERDNAFYEMERRREPDMAADDTSSVAWGDAPLIEHDQDGEAEQQDEPGELQPPATEQKAKKAAPKQQELPPHDPDTGELHDEQNPPPADDGELAFGDG